MGNPPKTPVLLALLIGLNCHSAPGLAQTPLTLPLCYELAAQHAPLHQQLTINDQQTAVSQRLAAQRWLPQVVINGQATYQTEVTRLPLDVPGVVPVAKDQYRLTLDATQTLYDGGSTRRQQELTTLGGAVSNQQVAVSLYRLRAQVNELFFGLLVLDVQQRQRQNLQTDLRQRRRTLDARRTHGVATGQELARLDAEVVTLDQQLRELTINREALLRQLGELIGQALPLATVLETPPSLPPAEARPEPILFQRQREQLAGQSRANDARLAPRLSVFGQAGYGRPGLNVLRNDFHPYGQGGVRLTWDLNSFYARRLDREALRLSQQAVAVQEAAFDQQQRLELAGQAAARARYDALLETDRALIPLRERIQQTAAVQLEQGLIGFADYYTEAANLMQAHLNEQLHHLQLLQTQVAERTTRGTTD